MYLVHRILLGVPYCSRGPTDRLHHRVTRYSEYVNFSDGHNKNVCHSLEFLQATTRRESPSDYRESPK